MLDEIPDFEAERNNYSELGVVQLLTLLYCGIFISILGCNIVILFSNWIIRQD